MVAIDRSRGRYLTNIRTLAEIEEEMEQANETDFIIDGLIDAGMTTIIGNPFMGKTFLTMEIMRALTTREPLFGRDVLREEPVNVMYLTTDPRGERTLTQRAREHGLDMDRIFAQPFYTPEFKREWRDIVDDLIGVGIGFCVIDNTSDLADDANGPKEVKEILDGLRRIIDARIPLLNIHHRNAIGGDFGSILWTKSTRAKLELTGNPRSRARRLKGTFNDQGAYEWGLNFEPESDTVFTVTYEKDADEVRDETEARAEEQKQKRDKATLDKNAEIARWIVANCTGSIRETARAVEQKFGSKHKVSAGTARNNLSAGKAYGVLVEKTDYGWRLAGPLAEDDDPGRVLELAA